MAQEGFKRRLAAILSGDVEGYSRLMREDEESTIRRLTNYRTAMTNLIQQYRGRVVDAPGDNLLAEFGSVVDAVNCAVEIQRELAERNAQLPKEHRMKFRIGVNLGDVFEEGDRIYGDGVNIAARMESLAEAGGICISGTVYDSIVSKLGLEYEYLGEQEVKNIPEPIRSFRVLSFPGAAAHRVIKAKKAVGKTWRNIVLAIAVILVVAGAVVIWNNYLSPSRPQVEAASVERMAFPLPDKPSIAVLPFVNMSENTQQEYFSDGITEDLITDLSKINGLFVIARNSVFTYKGKAVKIRQVAEDLGVRYVLEGSVRRAGDQVRINAQLIDATTGGHLWADRYDGQMDNVFVLQDSITQKIVEALEVKLTSSEEKQIVGKETNSTEAYDTFLKGWAHYRRKTPEDFTRALPYLEEAVERDPGYSRAYAALAAVYWKGSLHGWTKYFDISPAESKQKAEQYLQEAMKDPTPLAHYIASDIYRAHGRHQDALTEATRAIALDANDPVGYYAMAGALIQAGNPVEGADFIKKAMRLDPHYQYGYLYWLGVAQFNMERFDEAAATLEEITKRNPDMEYGFLFLAATYGHLGREQEAKSAMQTFRELRAKAGWDHFRTLESVEIFEIKEQKDVERLREGLRIAGVPPARESVVDAATLISHPKEGYYEVKGAPTIDVAKAKALFDRGVPFLDVRAKYYYDSGHIPGAVYINAQTVFSEVELSKIVRKDQEVIIYCGGPT
jgi:TolB-like protein/class 3 adenylate cyclase